MKSFGVAIFLIALLASPAVAGEKKGEVPKSTLVKLGLAFMEILPEKEGMKVRGDMTKPLPAHRMWVNGAGRVTLIRLR